MAEPALSQDISADRPGGGPRTRPRAAARSGADPPAGVAVPHGIAARCGAIVLTKPQPLLASQLIDHVIAPRMAG
ncbi:hypothetical protein GCM10009839_56840 [Catenulispora yoronensis]|uniref:Uncharacterized protein n=1 Tax=Catenulispora yoronensis TaxID=450799 RepID=A0ABP5GFB7_9ACTN